MILLSQPLHITIKRAAQIIHNYQASEQCLKIEMCCVWSIFWVVATCFDWIKTLPDDIIYDDLSLHYYR